jgi:hypothetical protein
MQQYDGGGGRAEEAVREFFRRLGYFSVRNIKALYHAEEITDIDIWAYGIGCPTHRARVIVDSKYKIKHAQVFERILWVEGLRRAIGLEHAIVATTDKREAAREFAARLNMRLIGPDLFDRLIEENAHTQRFTEEEFLKKVISKSDKLVGRFHERIESSKRLLLKLDYDSANLHLENLAYYAPESTRIQDRTTAVRLFYLSAAFLLITLDFVTRDAPFLEEQHVRDRIDEGIRFGSRGRNGTYAFLDKVGKKQRSEIMRAAESVRADILSDFFWRFAGNDWFLKTANDLEGAAFNKEFVPVANLPAPCQSVIGILLDYFQIDRDILFGLV